jgi:hypothetical protein
MLSAVLEESADTVGMLNAAPRAPTATAGRKTRLLNKNTTSR